MFIYVGDDEHKDPRFVAAGVGAAGLYFLALSWCADQVRGNRKVPDDWFVPSWVVRGWGAQRYAGRLVDNHLWEKVQGGYRISWIRDQNTTAKLREVRQRDRDKPARKRVATQPPADGNSPGEVWR